MTVTDKKELVRYCVICQIEEIQMINIVTMDRYPELGYECFNNIRDEGGDAIIVSSDIAFVELRAGSLVQTTFPVGTVPSRAQPVVRG